MARPYAIDIELSEADRAVLLGWSRCRETAPALALRVLIVSRRLTISLRAIPEPTRASWQVFMPFA